MAGGFLERLGQGLGFGNQSEQPKQVDPSGLAASSNNPAAQVTEGATAEVTASEKYKDLFQPVEVKQPDPIFAKLPDGEIQKIASQQNFLEGIDPKILATIESGGQDGVRATLKLVQQVGANSYAKSAESIPALIEAALAKERENTAATVPGLIRSATSASTLAASLPQLMSDPSLVPVANAVRMQVEAKHPNASPAEVSQLTQEYFMHLSSKLGGTSETPEAKAKAKTDQGTDWENFFAE